MKKNNIITIISLFLSVTLIGGIAKVSYDLFDKKLGIEDSSVTSNITNNSDSITPLSFDDKVESQYKKYVPVKDDRNNLVVFDFRNDNITVFEIENKDKFYKYCNDFKLCSTGLDVSILNYTPTYLLYGRKLGLYSETNQNRTYIFEFKYSQHTFSKVKMTYSLDGSYNSKFYIEDSNGTSVPKSLPAGICKTLSFDNIGIFQKFKYLITSGSFYLHTLELWID